jgi:four helix bundle protein
MFEFQHLEVYKKAKQFYSGCQSCLRNGQFENYVINQLGRSSLSVALNIAEGSGKFSNADRRNYFTIARASLFECIATLDILCDEGQITEYELEKFQKEADVLSRMLFTMIRNLR